MVWAEAEFRGCPRRQAAVAEKSIFILKAVPADGHGAAERVSRPVTVRVMPKGEGTALRVVVIVFSLRDGQASLVDAALSCPQAALMSCPLLLRTMAVMWRFQRHCSKASTRASSGAA